MDSSDIDTSILRGVTWYWAIGDGHQNFSGVRDSQGVFWFSLLLLFVTECCVQCQVLKAVAVVSTIFSQIVRHGAMQSVKGWHTNSKHSLVTFIIKWNITSISENQSTFLSLTKVFPESDLEQTELTESYSSAWLSVSCLADQIISKVSIMKQWVSVTMTSWPSSAVFSLEYQHWRGWVHLRLLPVYSRVTRPLSTFHAQVSNKKNIYFFKNIIFPFTGLSICLGFLPSGLDEPGRRKTP